MDDKELEQAAAACTTNFLKLVESAIEVGAYYAEIGGVHPDFPKVAVLEKLLRAIEGFRYFVAESGIDQEMINRLKMAMEREWTRNDD